MDAVGPGRIWQRYELAFFEYHCWESDASADAELWYRSHQPVMVLRMDGDEDFLKMTEQERYDAACLLSYRVRFADGHEGTAMEDELMDEERHYCRPDPPARATVQQANAILRKVLR